jgi:hypothetical protein
VIEKLTLPKWPPDIHREWVETLASLAVRDGLVPERYLPPASRIAAAWPRSWASPASGWRWATPW